jgi:TetR/AcrR family transcriptional repressor of bet genes
MFAMPGIVDKREPRKLSRNARRTQLIEATIETLGKRGYSRTTLTEVANEAGLSHGLVNFHFQSKEKLLEETLQYLAEEYRTNWLAALAAAPERPAEQLDAMIRADFNPPICTPARLSAWCAFWGEAQSRPLYQANCASNDEEYKQAMDDICTRLVAEGGYDHDPVLAARAIRVTSEGVWLDVMTSSEPFRNDDGLATVLACARAFFPRHFTPSGVKRD